MVFYNTLQILRKVRDTITDGPRELWFIYKNNKDSASKPLHPPNFFLKESDGVQEFNQSFIDEQLTIQQEIDLQNCNVCDDQPKLPLLPTESEIDENFDVKYLLQENFDLNSGHLTFDYNKSLVVNQRLSTIYEMESDGELNDSLKASILMQSQKEGFRDPEVTIVQNGDQLIVELRDKPVRISVMKKSDPGESESEPGLGLGPSKLKKNCMEFSSMFEFANPKPEARPKIIRRVTLAPQELKKSVVQKEFRVSTADSRIPSLSIPKYPKKNNNSTILHSNGQNKPTSIVYSNGQKSQPQSYQNNQNCSQNEPPTTNSQVENMLNLLNDQLKAIDEEYDNY